MKQVPHPIRIVISLMAIQALLSWHGLQAQSGPYLFSGAGYMANGQIGLLVEDAEAALVLPALLATRDHGGWTAGVARRIGLNDLTEASGAVHLRLPWKDHIALGIQHSGIDGYSEQRITLGYARKLFDKLSAGVQFDYNRSAADEYEDRSAISWSLSIHAPLMKQLSMSAFLYNPLGAEDELDLPSLVRIGVLYSPSEKVGIAMEAEKDWRHEVRLKAGFNYHIHPRLNLSWGIGTSPSLIHAGIRWSILNHMAVGGGWRYHAKLGSSLSASISQYHQP